MIDGKAASKYMRHIFVKPNITSDFLLLIFGVIRIHGETSLTNHIYTLLALYWIIYCLSFKLLFVMRINSGPLYGQQSPHQVYHLSWDAYDLVMQGPLDRYFPLSPYCSSSWPQFRFSFGNRWLSLGSPTKIVQGCIVGDRLLQGCYCYFLVSLIIGNAGYVIMHLHV
jgi:hypothetical protein